MRFPATDGFIALKSDGVGIQSLIAERCTGDDATTVVARANTDFRCIAELVEADAVRRLLPVTATSPSDRTAATQETRWSISAATVPAEAMLRVTCRPESLPD